MSSIWSDARTFLDIFIVSLIIYRLLVLIVGTRAVQLLKGVLILVLFSALASMLRFRLVSWLIGQSLWALSFAIPIVFQPELRKMLEEIGRGNLWQRQLPRDVAEQRVRHIMGALGYMKLHRIGALLVLQDNPLHDGALIMNRYSLIAGGCYLPLIDAPEISRWYGTRHRAALGLSEISDAIVLVVSEERGEISLAFKGRLSKNLKDAQVEKLLMHYFVGEPTFRSWRDRLQSFQQLLWDPSTRQLHEDHGDRS